jgi:hypothetical protein
MASGAVRAADAAIERLRVEANSKGFAPDRNHMLTFRDVKGAAFRGFLDTSKAS